MSSDMFKKFTQESVSHNAATRASDQRRLRADLEFQYPQLEPHWEEILPKKDEIRLVRCNDSVNLIVLCTTMEVKFWQHHAGPFMPHLRLVHQYPDILPRHVVDIGGCKFVLAGATIMCPGLTSKGGAVGDIPAGKPCAVYIEGKKHAVAVGVTILSGAQIAKKNSGPCIENEHHLSDGLWKVPVVQ